MNLAAKKPEDTKIISFSRRLCLFVVENL